MYTRVFTIISLVSSLFGCADVQNTTIPKHSSNLSLYSGSYTYNSSDTDDDATVDVHFRKNYEQYHSSDWLADGCIRDVIRKRTVTFTGAWVVVESNGELDVNAGFVRFKILGRRLQWLPSYDHDLFKDGIAHPEEKTAN
jgi:hypothetical protein